MIADDRRMRAVLALALTLGALALLYVQGYQREEIVTDPPRQPDEPLVKLSPS